MGLKGSGPFLQRSMSSKVLAGYVTCICEIYIDDVLVHGTTDDECCKNFRKVLLRLRENKVTANPRKTRLGLKEVEYVEQLISSTGTSFTPEKRLQVLDFPLPTTESCTANDCDGTTPTKVNRYKKVQGLQETELDRRKYNSFSLLQTGSI